MRVFLINSIKGLFVLGITFPPGRVKPHLNAGLKSSRHRAR
jgi:hypothetical protein